MFVGPEPVTCFVPLFKRLEFWGSYQIFGRCEDLSAFDNPLPKIPDWIRVPNSKKEESLHNKIKCQEAMFGDRILVGARFSVPVQTGPGAHPASCTMGTGSFPGVKSGRGVTLTPHPLLVLWSRKSRAISLLPLWAARPVQSLSACTRVHFSFTFISYIYVVTCSYVFSFFAKTWTYEYT